MKGFKKVKKILLMTAMMVGLTIIAAFLMLHRRSEAELPVSVTAKMWGGIAGIYNDYRVYEDSGKYYIECTTDRNSEPSERYEITKEEFTRSVNKKLLDTESFKVIVKHRENSASDGFYYRSVIRYKDGTEKEFYDAPFYNEFAILMDSKRLEAGRDEDIDKENNRIATAFSEVCYKYRVKDAEVFIFEKTGEGDWELSRQRGRQFVYRGDNSEITPMEAAGGYLKNDELEPVEYHDDNNGIGITIYIRSSDRITRPMLLHEIESILMDKGKTGCSELPYKVIRIIYLLFLEVLVVLSAILINRAERRIRKHISANPGRLINIREKMWRHKWAIILIPVIILLGILILRNFIGNVTLDEDTGELTLSGCVSREDSLKYADNSNVMSIVAKNGTKLPKDCHQLFASAYEVEKDRKEYHWPALQYIDLAQADTSRVTDMSCMFRGDSFLQGLNISGMDTHNVTDMSYMFYGCYCIKELDLSSFDTSNVTSMSKMFNECRSLETVDLSHFDTSKVTDMKAMFSGCMSLRDPDLTSFDTSCVTDMEYMFDRCYAIETLDLSSFDTSGVKSSKFMINTMRDIDTIYVSKDKWNLTDGYIEERYKLLIEYK